MPLERLAVNHRPADFVNLREMDSTILIDLRYASSFNFIGRPVDGYQSARCWLSRPAALAIATIQKDLLPRGMSLLVFDAYRPQRAVNHFIRWSRDIHDQKMKSEFYPAIEKSELFEQGFLVKKSTHTRGSTLDLTIVKSLRQHAKEVAGETERKYGLDMGTRFDVFDERSFTFSDKISREQQENRKFLVDIMTQNGFENFPMEWWHYTLVNEPYIDTYFDFLP